MRTHRLSKWGIVVGYGVAQAAAIFLLSPAWIASAQNAQPDNPLGAFSWTEYTDILLGGEWLVMATMIITGICVAQLLFVLPVRRPTGTRERGLPLWVSLSIAGLALSALSTALVAATSQLIYTLTGFDIYEKTDVHINPAYVFVAWAMVNWAIATPLLIRFCVRGNRESMLSRLSSRLFLGTIIETAAIIPMDVLVRRRESCYCLAGTYFALLMCGAVGVIFLGPAILLPVLGRRRRRWYGGKCECCLYDMQATPKADRCPECGAGWRAEPVGPA